VSTLFHFPVRFECFPFQQAQTLSIQEECIPEKTSNGNSSLHDTFPGMGEKITFLSVEKKMEKKIINNYCHLELMKKTFQYGDLRESF